MIRKTAFALFLLLLIIRPFLCSMASPYYDLIFSSVFITTCILLLKKGSLSFSNGPCRLFGAFFMLALLISILFSANTEKSLSEFYKYAVYLLAFFAAGSLNEREKEAAIKTLLVGAVMVSFYALRFLLGGLMYAMDYLHNLRITEGFAMEYLSRGRAFVPFPTPSALAGFLILFTPLSASLLLGTKNNATLSPLKRTLKNSSLLMLVMLTILSLLATQSLGALLSLCIAVTIFFYLQKGAKAKKIFTLVFIGFALSGLVLFFLRNNSLHSFNAPLFSLSNRLSYWKQACVVISEHPITGVGLGNYPFFKSISPHNSYLQLWAETGVLGLISFLGLAYHVVKARKQYPALWIGSLAFLIHNLVDFTLFQPEAALFWWIVAALITSKAGQLRPAPQESLSSPD